MITCKQVSRSLSEKDYASLSPVRRAMLKLHVSLCVVCGKYNRQVMIMQDAARSLRQREDNPPAPGAASLTEHEKEAIKQAMRKPE